LFSLGFKNSKIHWDFSTDMLKVSAKDNKKNLENLRKYDSV